MDTVVSLWKAERRGALVLRRAPLGPLLGAAIVADVVRALAFAGW